MHDTLTNLGENTPNLESHGFTLGPLSAAQKERLDFLILRNIVLELLPLSHVENPSNLALIAALNSCYTLPSVQQSAHEFWNIPDS